MLSIVLPWIQIFIAASLFAMFLSIYGKLRRVKAGLIGLAATPILYGQIIYIEHFFKISILGTISMFLLIFLAYKFKAWHAWAVHSINTNFKSRRAKLKSRYYLVLILFIYIFVAVRLIPYPISWHDQLEYYRVSSQMYTSQSIDTKEIGIRPAIPLMHNYFAKFTSNNQVLEMQFQMLVFYYFTITLVGLFLLSREIAGKGAALFSTFLLTTCFNFINFTILGFKEVIISALSLCALIIIHEAQKKGERAGYFLYATLGVALGCMSFIHMGGVVLSIFVLIATIVIDARKLNKHKFKYIITIFFFYVFSFNELTIFTKWILSGIVNTTLLTKVAGTASLELVAAKEFASFGIVDNLDKLTGKLQGFVYINSFGFVYWVALILLGVGFRKILKSPFSRLILLINIMYLFFIIDPFHMFLHYSSYVFVVSPKYYLTILPLFVLLASNGYEKLASYLSRAKNLRIFLMATGVGFLVLSQEQIVLTITKSMSFVVPMHYKSMEYYTNKTWQILVLGASISIICSLMLFILKKHTKDLNEIFITLLIIVIPFVFVLNNYFDLPQTLKSLPKPRHVKAIELLDTDNQYTKPASIMLAKIAAGQNVYISTEDSWANKYIGHEVDILNNSYFNKNYNNSLICNPDDFCNCSWLIIAKDNPKIHGCTSYFQLEYENPSYILLRNSHGHE